MKQKLLNKLWLRVGMIVAIMTTALSGTAWAETSTVTASKVTSSSASWTGSAGETWSVTVTGGATNQNVTSEYAQVGTKNSPSSSITLSTSGINGTITSVVLDCASYNGLATVSCTVGGSAFGTQSQSSPSWSNNSGGNVTFNGSASGAIVITMTNGSNGRAMYIKSITVTYTPGGSSAVETTTTINADGITNTDVYTSTVAGSLSASVTAGGNAVAGATVTWSGNNDDVATINASTGAVTLVGAGSVTFTANYAGVANTYQESSDTYEMTVTSSAPYVQPTTVEITPNYDFWGQTAQFSGSTYSNLSGSQDNVSLAWSRGTGSTYANTTAMRFYKDNTLTFTAPTGYEIKSIVLAVSGTYSDLTFSPSGYDSENTTWSGSSSTVTMSRPSNGSSYATISKFTITIGQASTDPSISADNVEIAYNATEGSIAFTVTNPVDGGQVSATTEANWLTSGSATSTSPISFTCSANSETTARTATVTLTYTYNSSETVTTTVTVTQAAAPESYTTIPALFAAATSTETGAYVTFNNWVVSGVSTNGKNVFVTDNAGNGFVIYSSSDQSSTYAVGNILSGTAVTCGLKKYNGFAELLNVDASDLTITTGGTVTAANVAMADLAGVNTGALVSYENLTCSVSDGKYYLSDGTTTLQVYNTLYAFGALEAGKTYNITGVYQQFNDTKEILPRSAADIVEYDDNRTAVATIGDDLTPTTINIDDIDDFSLTITPASGLTEGTDYIVVWETSDASILELADETYEAKAVGSVSVTVTVTPDDDTTYKEVSKAFTVNVIDPNVKGTEANPYTVAEVIAMNPGTTAVKTDVYVKGYIVGCYHNNNFTNDVSSYEESNLALSDSPTETSSVIPVQLTNNTTPRTEFNIVSKPYNVGVAQVVVKADVIKYFSVPGLKNTETITKVAEYVEVTSAGYATYCTDVALDFAGTDITAYVGTIDSNKQLTFTPNNQAPANTGLLLKGTAGSTTTATVPVIASASSVNDNCLTGTTAGKNDLTANDYILNKVNDGVGFYKAGSYTTLGAHKAYIPAAVGGNVKGFTIDFDDDATGISLMEDGRSQMEDGAIYNIAGQRLDNSQFTIHNSQLKRGIYIVNGKKIMVK